MKSKRFKVTLNGVQHGFSPQQVDMLSKKSLRVKLPLSWTDEKRVNGLVKRNLITLFKSTSKSATYKRTDLGDQIDKILVARTINRLTD